MDIVVATQIRYGMRLRRICFARRTLMNDMQFSLDDHNTINRDTVHEARYLNHSKQKSLFFPLTQHFASWDDHVDPYQTDWQLMRTPLYDEWVESLRIVEYSIHAKVPRAASEPFSAICATKRWFDTNSGVNTMGCISGHYNLSLLESIVLKPVGAHGIKGASYWIDYDTACEYRTLVSRTIGVPYKNPAMSNVIQLRGVTLGQVVEGDDGVRKFVVGPACDHGGAWVSPPLVYFDHGAGGNKNAKAVVDSMTGQLTRNAQLMENALFLHNVTTVYVDMGTVFTPFPDSVCLKCNHQKLTVFEYFHSSVDMHKYIHETGAASTDLLCPCDFCQCCVSRGHRNQPVHMFCRCPLSVVSLTACNCNCERDDPALITATAYAKREWWNQNGGPGVVTPAHLV